MTSCPQGCTGALFQYVGKYTCKYKRQGQLMLVCIARILYDIMSILEVGSSLFVI